MKGLSLSRDFPLRRVSQAEIGGNALSFCLNVEKLGMTVGLILMVRIVVIEDRFLPEVQTVHISMAPVQRALMRFERRRLRIARRGIVFNRKSACDDHS